MPSAASRRRRWRFCDNCPEWKSCKYSCSALCTSSLPGRCLDSGMPSRSAALRLAAWKSLTPSSAMIRAAVSAMCRRIWSVSDGWALGRWPLSEFPGRDLVRLEKFLTDVIRNIAGYGWFGSGSVFAWRLGRYRGPAFSAFDKKFFHRLRIVHRRQFTGLAVDGRTHYVLRRQEGFFRDSVQRLAHVIDPDRQRRAPTRLAPAQSGWLIE